jgi:predicted Zn-dependent peptidase
MSVAYNFSKEYLSKGTDIYVKDAIDAFNKISFEDWINAANKVLNVKDDFK